MTTFKNARNLSEAFVYATEVSLATLSDLLMVKKAGKSRIARQQSICEGMLTICVSPLIESSRIDWGHSHHRQFPRVSEIMESAATKDVTTALAEFCAKFTEPQHSRAAQP